MRQVEFSPIEQDYIQRVRDLYQEAFKHQKKKAMREFYAHSTAQFIICGQQRLAIAMTLVEQEYTEMFSSYFIQQGQRYIRSYLEAMESSAN